jgi:hypothetical protein
VDVILTFMNLNEFIFAAEAERQKIIRKESIDRKLCSADRQNPCQSAGWQSYIFENNPTGDVVMFNNIKAKKIGPRVSGDHKKNYSERQRLHLFASSLAFERRRLVAESYPYTKQLA